MARAGSSDAPTSPPNCGKAPALAQKMPPPQLAGCDIGRVRYSVVSPSTAPTVTSNWQQFMSKPSSTHRKIRACPFSPEHDIFSTTNQVLFIIAKELPHERVRHRTRQFKRLNAQHLQPGHNFYWGEDHHQAFETWYPVLSRHRPKHLQE